MAAWASREFHGDNEDAREGGFRVWQSHASPSPMAPAAAAD
jgi:hypothetical protein